MACKSFQASSRLFHRIDDFPDAVYLEAKICIINKFAFGKFTVASIHTILYKGEVISFSDHTSCI
jgi:hypothetical protein